MAVAVAAQPTHGGTVVENAETKGLRIALIVVRAVALALLLLLSAFTVLVFVAAAVGVYGRSTLRTVTLAVTSVLLFASLASAVIQAVLLAYTARPARRVQHRGCCCATAAPYSTDLAWDIVMCICWGMRLLLGLFSMTTSSATAVAMVAVVTALSITAAALSSVMRRRLLAAAGAPVTASVAKDVV